MIIIKFNSIHVKKHSKMLIPLATSVFIIIMCDSVINDKNLIMNNRLAHDMLECFFPHSMQCIQYAEYYKLKY